MRIDSPADDFLYPAAPLRAVAFDLDGLMFNTEDLYKDVGNTVLGRRGKKLTPGLLDQMIGLKSSVALQVMIDYHQLDDSVDGLAAESDAVFRAIIPSRLAPMHGLFDLLDALDTAGLPKGVATSSPRDFAYLVLGQFDLPPRLDFVLGAEDVLEGKPAPEIYLTAARLAGVRPEEMLVLEDSGVGCQAGQAAGAYTVAVPHHHTIHHNFDGVSFRAESLADPRIRAVLGLDG